jgi:predicted amidohydrolase YtcJ
MRQILISTLAVLVGLGLGCNTVPDAASTADAIYFGGPIITVNDAQPSVEAVAVKDGKIFVVGTRADIEKAHKGANTQMIDLAVRTLVPGFLDPHSHYINSLSVANQVNIMAPPAGPGKDIPAIVATLKQFRDQHKIPAGVLIQAYGCDENAMPNGVGLTRYDLDKDFPDNPVMVGHVSMHGAVLNSAATKKWNVTAKTKTPAGGIILRKPGTNEPTGLLMETAYLPIYASLPQPTREEEVDWSRAGQMLYAAAGITTAQEGLTHASDVALIQRAAAAGVQVVDVVSYPIVSLGGAW